MSITAFCASDNAFLAGNMTCFVAQEMRCPMVGRAERCGYMPRPRVETPNLDRLSALLSELATLRTLLESIENDVVLLARDMGATWEAVGEAHDPPIARQTAQKKYSHPKPRRERPT